MEWIFPILLLLILLGLSGFLSASETALFSLSSMKVRSYRSSENPRYRLIADLISRPKDLLVTILMLNIAVNLIIQNITSHVAGRLSGWTLKVGLPLVLTLVFGEILPKSLAIQNNSRISYRVSPVIAWFRSMSKPLRQILITITSILSRVLFFWLRQEEDISSAELKHALKTSKKHGVLHDDEAELVQGYLKLQEAQVREHMRPREEMILYNIDDPISTLHHLFVEQQCSRIPVFQGDVDHILGIITARQFLLNRNNIHSPQALQRVLQPPFFVPETTPARTLLRQFEQRNQVLALVVDEYGATAGLITKEDLVEEVVGEIKDKRDLEKRYTRANSQVIIASGKLELTEFEDLFGVLLKSPNNMVTLGGWLTEQLGDIPKSGTNYVTDDFLFHILAADPHRIRRVYIRQLNKDPHSKERAS